jgi:hypothetical protein
VDIVCLETIRFAYSILLCVHFPLCLLWFVRIYVGNHGNLYNLEFNKVQGKNLLVACGDAGVLVYDWDTQILPLLLQTNENTDRGSSKDTSKNNNNNKNIQVQVVNLTPTLTFQPHPSILERDGVEINATSCDEQNGWLYGAAGDLFGCYQWDIETATLRQTLSGRNLNPNTSQATITSRGNTQQVGKQQKHTDFLHTVKVVKGQGNTVLTGGEDGKLVSAHDIVRGVPDAKLENR